MPISKEIGAAIARPIGLKTSAPMASKDETLDSASLGTIRCSAVYQRVPHKSKVIPKKNAQIETTKRDCGLARENM